MESFTEPMVKEEVVGDIEYNLSELEDVSLNAPIDTISEAHYAARQFIMDTSSTQPTSTSGFPGCSQDDGNNQMIACFICCNNFIHPIQATGETLEQVQNRKKLLTNFCFHIKLNHLIIPDVCDIQQVPLCNGCTTLVNEVWELEEQLQKVHQKISKVVLETKKRVSRGENPCLSPTFYERKVDEDLNEFFPPTPVSTEVIISNLENIEPRPSQSPIPPVYTSAQRRRSSSETFSVARLDPRTLRVVAIKQEIGFRKPSPIGIEEPQQVQLDTSIIALKPEKRRRLFAGVEYFKCDNSNGKDVLICSICSHTVLVPKKPSKKDVTPNEQMKVHIQSEHTVEQAPKRGRVAAFECPLCMEIFSSRKSLLDHKGTHAAQKSVRQPAKSLNKSKIQLRKSHRVTAKGK